MATTDTDRLTVANLLGLKSKYTEPSAMRAAVRDGLPFRAFEKFMSRLGWTSKDFSKLLGIPPRTMARRKSRNAPLTSAESDRLWRLAFIVILAMEVLGSLEKARSWFGQPNKALGGTVPKELLDTEVGTRQVEEVLNRISHGIYS